MTKITKVANYIFRGSVAVALGTVVAEVMSGGEVFSKLFEGVNKVEDAVANVTGLDLAGILGNVHMATIALIVAAILSCVAFKSAGKVASIFRTVVLFGMAGLSVLGSTMLGTADVVARSLHGAASTAEIESVKPLIDVFTQQGHTDVELAGAFTMTGVILAVAIAAVLAVLALTSIVSVVKTAKADTCAA